MARDIESLVLTMSADIRRMEKSLAQGQRTFDKTADAIERRQRQLDKNLANLGREMGNFARPVQLAATVALGAITAMSYQAARRAEAVSGAFTQTFRDMPKEAAAAAAGIANEFGRLETDIKDNFTQLRSVLTALGVDAKQSLEIVDQLQRRSLDIAAFRDVSDAEAFRAVISGITGETEPLKRFGIVVNETAVKAELLALGFKGNATNASEAAKSIARTNIIMRQSAEMQGQVAREADTLAEQEKRVRVEFTKAAEDFGKQFLPVAAKVLSWATDALKAFNDLPSGVQVAGLAMLGLIAAGGPIAGLLAGLGKVIKLARETRAALAAATVVGGGKGGAILPVAGAAAVGAGLLVSQGSFAPAPDRDMAAVQRDLAFNRQNLSRLEGSGASSGRVERAKQRVATSLAELSRLQRAQDAAVEALETGSPVDTSVPGGFSLNGAQQSAGGSGGAGRAKSEASAAARRAEAQEALSLQRAIDIARASGDEASVKAAEERQTLVQMTAQYEAAGYADARARAVEHLSFINAAEAAAEEREKAEEQIEIILAGRNRQLEREADYQQRIQDQMFDRLGMEAELARLSGHEGRLMNAERELWIEERINELLRLRPELSAADARQQAGADWQNLDNADTEGRMRDEFRRSFSEGVRAAIDGDLGGFFESMADRFTDRMLENLADDLFDLLGQAAKGFASNSGGGSNWMTAIASLFAGKRATGGGVVGGQAYITGERRPEVFVPHTSGTIIPSVNAAMNRAQRAASAPSMISPVVRIELTGANGDQTIRYLAAEAARQAYAEAVSTSRRVVPAQQAQRQRYSRGG
jgi:hypothetical protein